MISHVRKAHQVLGCLVVIVLVVQAQLIEPEIWGTDVSVTEMKNIYSTVGVIGDFSNTAFFDGQAVTPCGYGSYFTVYESDIVAPVTATSEDKVIFSGLEVFSTTALVTTFISPDSAITINGEYVSNENTFDNNEWTSWSDGQDSYVLRVAIFKKSSIQTTFTDPIVSSDEPFIVNDIDFDDKTIILSCSKGDATTIHTPSGDTNVLDEGFIIHIKCLDILSNNGCAFDRFEPSTNSVLFFSGTSQAMEDGDSVRISGGTDGFTYTLNNFDITSMEQLDDKIYVGGSFTNAKFSLLWESTSIENCNHDGETGSIGVSIILSGENTICKFAEGDNPSQLSIKIADQAVDTDAVYSLGYFGRIGDISSSFTFGDCCASLSGRYTTVIMKLGLEDLSCKNIEVFGNLDSLYENARGLNIGVNYNPYDVIVAALNPMSIQSTFNNNANDIGTVTTIPLVGVNVNGEPCENGSPSPPPPSENNGSSVTSSSVEVDSQTVDVSVVGNSTEASSGVIGGNTKNNSWLTIVFLIIVGFLIVGGLAAFFLYKKRNQLVPGGNKGSSRDGLNRFTQLEEDLA